MSQMFAFIVHFWLKYRIDLPKCENTSECTPKSKKIITNNQMQTVIFNAFLDAKAILIFLTHNQNGR